MKVTLMATCLVDRIFPEVGINTVELLEKLGCEVEVPLAQICCGQPAYNSGYTKDAQKAMVHLIDALSSEDYIVTPSGSCATMLRDYKHIFENTDLAAKASNLSDRTYELTEFIVNVLKITDINSYFKGNAVYHASCHMTRLLKVKEEPKMLLKQVNGLEVKPMDGSDNCCGFGGTFAVKMGDISGEMVTEKVANIKNANVEYVISSDCGCMMNIKGKLARDGSNIKVMHIAEILNSNAGDML